MSVGFAPPTLPRDQCEIAAMIEQAWDLRAVRLNRWRRIVAGSGVESRQMLFSPADAMHLSTADRMCEYERVAPEIACTAARHAMAAANVSPSHITDLIVVSCTGFSAPGVDSAIASRLGLASHVRRTVVGFMGCFGAIIGLRTAAGACALDENGVALVVCVELCSLHMPPVPTDDDLVAGALFADGAAAAVVAGRGTRTALQGDHIGQIIPGQSMLIDDGRDAMSWRIGDHGFTMTLARTVPAALRDALDAFAITAPMKTTWIVHPGGPGILDAVDAGLGLRGSHGIEQARDVLRCHGNMSSPTVLHVLHETLAHRGAAPFRLLAFGPGLSIEAVDIEG